MRLVLIILVILLLLGGLPQLSGHIHGMGWGPSGLAVVVLVVLLIVLLRGGL